MSAGLWFFRRSLKRLDVAADSFRDAALAVTAFQQGNDAFVALLAAESTDDIRELARSEGMLTLY